MFQSVLRRLRESQSAELEGSGAAEAGFTLIELMVVLLIIAILLAIAIPTFLGVTSSANDRAAQSNLTNALTEATAQYQSSGQSYSGISALLSSSAPEYSWASGTGTSTAVASLPTDGCASTFTNCVNVYAVDVAAAGDQQGLIMSTMSKTNTCWWVAQLQAKPQAVATLLTAPAFDTGLSGATGGQTGATQAGTYYAKQINSSLANCNSQYPESKTGGFTWGSSFSSPGND